MAQLTCVGLCDGSGLVSPVAKQPPSPPEFVIPPSLSPHANDAALCFRSCRHSLTTSLNPRTIRIAASARWPADAATLRLLHLRAPRLALRIVCCVACLSGFFIWLSGHPRPGRRRNTLVSCCSAIITSKCSSRKPRWPSRFPARRVVRDTAAAPKHRRRRRGLLRRPVLRLPSGILFRSGLQQSAAVWSPSVILRSSQTRGCGCGSVE